MTIFQKIKLLFAVKSGVEEIAKEIKMENASGKPGWKTTEFWGKIGLQVMTLWGAVKGFIPGNYAIIIGTSLEAVYTICRTVAKAVSDIQATKKATATVTTTEPVTTVTTPT